MGCSCAEPPSVAFVTPTMGRQELHPQLHATFLGQTVPGQLYVLDESPSPSPYFSRPRERTTYVHRRPTPRIDGVTRIGESRNFLNSLTRETYLCHFDDDDVYAPDYAETMIARLGDAALAKLDVWRCLAQSVVFEWDTRVTGGRHWAVQGAGAQPVDIDAAEMGPEMGDGLGDAWRLGFSWSYVYPRSTWERFPFPVEGTEDIPWARTIRAAGGHIEFVSDRPDIALHTVHVDPMHPLGGSPHFPQRIVGAGATPGSSLRDLVKTRMLGALGGMDRLPDGQPIQIRPGVKYAILASVRRAHSLRSLAVRAVSWGVTVEQARDDVSPGEFGVAPPENGNRLVHVVGACSRTLTLPWSAPSFLRVLGETTKTVRAWASRQMGAGRIPAETVLVTSR